MRGSVHLCVWEGFNDGRFSPASRSEAVERGPVATAHHTRPPWRRAMPVTYRERAESGAASRSRLHIGLPSLRLSSAFQLVWRELVVL